MRVPCAFAWKLFRWIYMNIRQRRIHTQPEVLGFKNEAAACETGCKSKPDSAAHCALCQLGHRKKPRLRRPRPRLRPRPRQRASGPLHRPCHYYYHAGMLSEPKVHRLRRGIERGAYVASLESVSDPATVTGGHAWHAAGHGCLARTNRTLVLVLAFQS